VAVRQVERLERLELSACPERRRRKAVERLERAAVVECWRVASLFLEDAFRSFRSNLTLNRTLNERLSDLHFDGAKRLNVLNGLNGAKRLNE
jgi:hypothetical protein